ncbi:MAG TPA: CHRD domain-containing protein [Chitinophagaceae bacterium]|nr:CHRD domain-containing protein [Chitinophagaceae bacterium]
MKLIRLTALTSFVFGLVIATTSCEKVAEEKKTTDYQKNDIPMTGAKVIPTSVSTALGKLNVFYTKETRILNYTFTWSGLSGNPSVGVGLYGLAPEGYAVSPTSPIQTISTTGLLATGTYSGTLLADGSVIKEQDLLNGMYYIMLRTAAYPAGEIRAQIVFQ